MAGLRKHEPISEKFMERSYREHTICQQLRETYHKTDDSEIKMDLRIAVAMAKAMVRKLREYKADWDKEFWDDRERDKTS